MEVARACNYHTRALRHVRTLLTDDFAQTLLSVQYCRFQVGLL